MIGRDKKFFKLIFLGVLIFSSLFFVLEKPVEAKWASQVVISEVQITGGTGKTANDFIELYNPTDLEIDLSGWRLRKRTQTGTESSIRVFSQGKNIPAYGFFLWANSRDDFHLLIKADEWSTATIASNNSIALFDASGNLIDALAWGSGHLDPFVETFPFPTNPGANQSIERKASQYSAAISLASGGQEESSGNGWDTNNNALDFVLQRNSNPQNSFSPAENQPVLSQPLPEELLAKELLLNELEAESDSLISPTITTKKQKLILATKLSEIKNRNLGDLVRVEGIVSVEPGVLGVQIFYLSDFNSGIQIYSYHKDFPVLELGDRAEVTGEISQSRGEKRIKISSKNDIIILAKESPITARKILTGEINEEKIGGLFKVLGQVIEIRTNYFYLDDDSGEVKVYLRSTTEIKKPIMREGDWLEVRGIVSQYNDEFRILPRCQSDLRVVELAINEIKNYNKTSPDFSKSNANRLDFLILEFLSRRSAVKYLAISAVFLIIIFISLFIKKKKL